jgi:hypothetical protein
MSDVSVTCCICLSGPGAAHDAHIVSIRTSYNG